jgi:hypothetical protein
MPIVKTYNIAKSSSTGEGKNKFNFISGKEKVSEQTFFDLLKAKLLELLGEERKDKYDDLNSKVLEALESKKPVTIVDRNFEIKFKKKN